MKNNILVSLMKKAGEKASMVPIEVRSWPFTAHQPKMPELIRAQMEKKDR